MSTIRLSMDPQGLEKDNLGNYIKPVNQAVDPATGRVYSPVGKLSNRLARNIVNFSLEEIAQKSIAGYTFSAVFINNIRDVDSWIEQTEFRVDIDNSGWVSNNPVPNFRILTVYDCINYLDVLNLLPAFIYTTLSHTENLPKFRLVYYLEKPVTNLKFRNLIHKCLAYLYAPGQVDIGATTAASLYYPGKELIYEEYNNYLNPIELFNTVNKTLNPECLKDLADKADIQFNGALCVKAFETRPEESKDYEIIEHAGKIYVIAWKIKKNYKNLDHGQYTAYPFTKLEKNCQLWSDFLNEKIDDYYLIRDICFNMVQIQGGIEKVIQIINNIPTLDKKEKEDWEFRIIPKALEKGCYPTTCEKSSCPYLRMCNHHANMIITGIKGQIKKEEVRESAGTKEQVKPDEAQGPAAKKEEAGQTAGQTISSARPAGNKEESKPQDNNGKTNRNEKKDTTGYVQVKIVPSKKEMIESHLKKVKSRLKEADSYEKKLKVISNESFYLGTLIFPRKIGHYVKLFFQLQIFHKFQGSYIPEKNAFSACYRKFQYI